MRRFAEDAAERSEVDTSVVSGVDDDEEVAAEAVVEGGGGGTPNPVTRADLRQQGKRSRFQRSQLNEQARAGRQAGQEQRNKNSAKRKRW